MIKKAIVPVAGKGTRLMPITSALPKALFPVVNTVKQHVKPIIHIILEELKEAGINEVIIVVSPGHDELIDGYFNAVKSIGDLSLLDIRYIEQLSPKGFGDAVYRAKDFIGDDDFVLLLGDHVHLSAAANEPCIAQVINAFINYDCRAMIGVHEVGIKEIDKVGIVKGTPLKDNVFSCVDFVEKPSLDSARESLRTPGLEKDVFLGHCGIYVFSSEIFDCLEQVNYNVVDVNEEIEFASAQSMLLSKYPEDYYLYLIKGRAYDMGTPEGYIKTLNAFCKYEGANRGSK